MTTFFVTVEGPLAYFRGQLSDAPPSDLAPYIWAMMKSAFHPQIVVISAEEYNREVVRNWLKMAGLKGYDVIETLHPFSTQLTKDEWKADLIRRYRATGAQVELFIDSSPAACAQVLARGTRVALFASAAFAQPEWRPDGQVQAKASWQRFADEVSLQKAATIPTAPEEDED